MVRRGHGFTQALLDQFVVAVVVEPDAVDVHGVLQVAHGVEGHVDLAIDVVIVALLHLGVKDADDGEEYSVETDGFAQRPSAREELGLGLRCDNADVGALLVLGTVEEATLIGIHLQNVLIGRADAVYRPGVAVQVVLYRHVFRCKRRDMRDAGHAG